MVLRKYLKNIYFIVNKVFDDLFFRKISFINRNGENLVSLHLIIGILTLLFVPALALSCVVIALIGGYSISVTKTYMTKGIANVQYK